MGTWEGEGKIVTSCIDVYYAVLLLQECRGVCGWKELHSAAKYGLHQEIPEDHPR